MSLHPSPVDPVPEETARVARAAFPKGSVAIRVRDELGVIYRDELFAPLFPARGRPAEAPWRLMLVTLLQFAENLTDRQAAEAVRSRIDWKYALALPLEDAGFDASVLSEFRTRLLRGEPERRLFDTLLDRLQAAGLLEARGRQRTDSTHVLAAVRALTRLGVVGETLRHALNSLAVVAPAWLRAQLQPDLGPVGRALRAPLHRLPPAAGGDRPGRARGGHRRGRALAARRHLRPRGAALAARGAGGRDPAPGVGAAVPRHAGGNRRGGAGTASSPRRAGSSNRPTTPRRASRRSARPAGPATRPT